jgi:hypothetical protein
MLRQKGNPKRKRGTTPEKAKANANLFLAYASGFLRAKDVTSKALRSAFIHPLTLSITPARESV